MEQRTLEWYRARLGNFTGSCVGKLMGSSRTKGEVFSKTAISYIYEVAFERWLDPDMVDDDAKFEEYVYINNVTTRAMQYGIDMEGKARFEYMALTGNIVDECGSVDHPEIEWFSSSPDGLIGDDGCLEIKCLGKKSYMAYLFSDRTSESLLAINPEYWWQCQSHMAVTGRKWCDFVVYNPNLSKSKMLVFHIERDEDAITKLCERIKLANDKIDEFAKYDKPND